MLQSSFSVVKIERKRNSAVGKGAYREEEKSVLYLESSDDQIKKRIFLGKYPVGTFLPTETGVQDSCLTLVEITRFGEAIEMLATEEFVEKKKVAEAQRNLNSKSL